MYMAGLPSTRKSAATFHSTNLKKEAKQNTKQDIDSANHLLPRKLNEPPFSATSCAPSR